MAADPPSTQAFRIGDWIVDPQRAKVRRGPEIVHLTPRAMAVLVHLAAAKGAVVSRNDILDAVWPRMSVTQDALAQCIVELRKAFRDSSRNPSVVETVPKVGIRLMPAVMDVTAQILPSATRRVSRRTTVAAIVAIGVVVTGIGLWLTERAPIARPTGRHSVALMPFTNEDALDDSARVLVDGIHDELLSRLAKIRDLEVIIVQATAVRSRHNVARDLYVATVLEGRVYQAEDGVHLNVQLVDADTDRLLWGDTYATVVTAKGSSQMRDIGSSIAAALYAALAPQESAGLRAVGSDNTRATDFSLSGNRR